MKSDIWEAKGNLSQIVERTSARTALPKLQEEVKDVKRTVLLMKLLSKMRILYLEWTILWTP